MVGKFTTALVLSFYDSGINYGLRESLLTARFCALHFCLNLLHSLPWLKAEKKKSLPCSLYFRCFSEFRKIAYFSRDLFLKAGQVEMAPDLRRVVREKVYERQSLTEGQVHANVPFERNFYSVVRCI